MLNKVTQGDVVERLSDVRSASVDLVIADPPYGIPKNFGLQDSYKDIESWIEWSQKWLAECKRVLKPTGSLLVYGIHNFLCYVQVELYRIKMHYVRQLIWHYENGFCGHSKLPRATYEPLLWFSKSKDFYFDPIREPYKSTDRLKYKVIKNGKVWQPNPNGRIVGDIWNIPTLAGRRFSKEKVNHPTQKPIALCDRLVTHLSRPGDVVLVPFAGSGSECVSAYRLGRHFIGIEINPDYCALAEKRLNAAGWLSEISRRKRA
jgi:DNA modification methylase